MKSSLNKRRIWFASLFSILTVAQCNHPNHKNNVSPYASSEETAVPIVDSNKIWIHRVNSVNKLEVVKHKYSGVELDVVFQDSIFDVNHPPAPSIGLNLKTLLASNKTKTGFGYWIDFKNLTESNSAESLERMLQICEELNIEKSQFVIEARNTSALHEFYRAGFPSSYYVPSGLYKMNDNQKAKTVKHIADAIANKSGLFISSNMLDYDILKTHFPDRQKLYWYTKRGTLKSNQADSVAQEVLKDSLVKVLLIKKKTQFER